MRSHFPLRRQTGKILLAAGSLLAACGVYAMSVPLQQETTVPVARGDVRRTKRAVGIVTGDQDVQMRFSSPSDSVSQVFVREGDIVKKGQTLATLRSDGISGVMTTAAAGLETAMVELEALKKGARSEDLAVLQAEADSKRAELARARQKLEASQEVLRSGVDALSATNEEAVIRLKGEVIRANGAISSQYGMAKIALFTLENIFDRLDVHDALVKHAPPDYGIVRADQVSVQQAIDAQVLAGTGKTDPSEVLKDMRLARATVAAAGDLLAEAALLLSGLPPTDAFTTVDQDGVREALVAQQSQLQGALTTLDSGIKNLQDAAAGINAQGGKKEVLQVNAKIARDEAQADIAVLEAALRITEAEFRQKSAPPLETDLALAAARVQQARGDLERIAAQHEKTVLRSPFSGRVSAVNLTPGQFPSLTEPAIVMQGTADRGVLVYLTDAEVAAIGPAATATVTFDADPGVHMQLRAEGLATGTTTVAGIESYRRMDFAHPHPELTPGMSGTVTIVVAERKNALVVAKSQLEIGEDGQTVVRVKRGDGIVRQPVVTGIEGDDGNVEIIEGLSGGESIIVGAARAGSFFRS